MSVRHLAQLTGSGTASADCGPAATAMAIDYASGGELRLSIRGVRRRMARASGATNPWDWMRALDSLDAPMRRAGLRPVRSVLQDGEGIGKLRELLFERRRPVLLCVDYGTVARRAPRLWSSTSFRAGHAILARRGEKRSGGDVVWVFDPLADGRTIGGKRMVQGPRWWPWDVLRSAAGSIRQGDRLLYAGRDRFLGVTVFRSLPLAEPVPPPDQPDPPDPPSPTDPIFLALADLEAQYEALGARIEALRAAVGPDSESLADSGEGLTVGSA